MSQKNEISLELQDKKIIISRIFNAPRELVFQAFTEAKHLESWWGPRIFSAKAESDPRPGGKFRLTMVGRDDAPEFGGLNFRGREYPMTGVYKEVVKPKKLVMATNLSEHAQDWKDFLISNIPNYAGEDFLNSEMTILFDDDGNKTKVTIISEFSSNGVRDAFAKTGMKEGWAESLDKLEEFLEKSK